MVCTERSKYIHLLVFGAVEMIKYHFPHPETVVSIWVILDYSFSVIILPLHTPGKRVNLRKGSAQTVTSIVTLGCAWAPRPTQAALLFLASVCIDPSLCSCDKSLLADL